MTSRGRIEKERDRIMAHSAREQSHFSSSSSHSSSPTHEHQQHQQPSRRTPTTTHANMTYSQARQDTPTTESSSNSSSQNGGVFDRVVRKLSKRVKPPSHAQARDRSMSATAATSSSEHLARNRTVLDPPSYTYVTTGAPSPTIEARAPLTSTQRGASISNRHRQKPSVQEWGPPPLTDQRFAQTLAQQEAEAEAQAQAQAQAQASSSLPRRSSSALRRNNSSSRRPFQHRSAHSATAHQPPPSATPQQYSQLASRSFDSLIGPSSIAQQSQSQAADIPPPPRYGQAQTAATVGRSASRSGPKATPATVASPTPVSPVNNGATGLTRKPTISSTTRAKPALDAPAQANITSTHFPTGFWPAGNNPPTSSDSNQVEELTSEEIEEQTRERESLVGKGPYWSIQRGWSRGIVTTLDEANRRTRGFPGPVVRYFGADDLDEALAFYRSSKTSGRRSSAIDNSDEDDEEVERVKRDSQTSIALGRSVSLMERKSQSQIQSRRMARGGMRSRGERGMTTKEESGNVIQDSTLPVVAHSDPIQAPQQAPKQQAGTRVASQADTLKTRPAVSQPSSTSVTITSSLAVLPTIDLGSSLKFYTQVIGLVLDPSAQNTTTQATLSFGQHPLLQLRRLPSSTGTSYISLTVQDTTDLTTLETRLNNAVLRDQDAAILEGWSSVTLNKSSSEMMVTDPSGNTLIFSLVTPATMSIPIAVPQRSLSPNNPFNTLNAANDPRLSLHLGSPFNAADERFQS
ncbi:unnamed protein product [Sympodiomycopsis kandeliae]